MFFPTYLPFAYDDSNEPANWGINNIDLKEILDIELNDSDGDFSDINDYSLFDISSLNVDNANGEYVVKIDNESYHIDINGKIKNFVLDESRIDELEIDIDIKTFNKILNFSKMFKKISMQFGLILR